MKLEETRIYKTDTDIKVTDIYNRDAKRITI